MSATGGGASDTCALVESPVQLLNVLEWADWCTRREGERPELTVVVLPPRHPASRGQLRRMAGLARDEGYRLLWREARGPAGARALPAVTPLLRRARRLVIGDPFSRWLQVLLSGAGSRAGQVVVVDDGTATLEFADRLGRGERLVRWHRSAPRGVRAALFAPIARRALRRLLPAAGHRVEIFTAMPAEAPAGVVVHRNELAWSRSRFGPPTLTPGADLVGTSLVETGVLAEDRYRAAVADLTARHGVTRYFAHRKEGPAKLRTLAEETGLEIVRPDLPLELVARTGPVGQRVLSFPSTVAHTLPLALRDTGVRITLCDLDTAWFAPSAPERARDFLGGVVRSACRAHGLVALPAPGAPAG